MDELAALLGVEPEYHDVWGQRHEPDSKTKLAILRAMGVGAKSDRELLEEITLRKVPRFVEPVHAVPAAEQPVCFVLNVPLMENVSLEQMARSLMVSITYEDGAREDNYVKAEDRGTFEAQGKSYLKLEITDAMERKPGYYRFVFYYSDGVKGETLLIVSPGRAYSNPALKRGWGVTLNLHAVRSYGNWGVGDTGDLRKLVRWSAELGADFVCTTPLHASPNSSAHGISPYSPVSRLYRNYLYIDMRHLPYLEERRYREKLLKLRNLDTVDFGAAAELKLRALEQSFAAIAESKGADALDSFMHYVHAEGPALHRFSLFMAASEELGGDWREWPEEYRDPEGAALRRFENRAILYKFTQWMLDCQLRDVQSTALGAGMRVGLGHDLALGSSAGGSDTWSAPGVFAIGADTGAPPDDFNRLGQNWGFPPLNPERLRESGYEIFINTIRKNLEHGGLLRIDHALGLFRSFWVPRAMEPAQGAYVRYPTEEMLHIIALESTRARTMVVAEDLGTVGQEVRETLNRFGVLSYRLLYFERDYPEPSFAAPESYPEAAFVAVGTHDLPTLRGFWLGRDIELKNTFSLYPNHEAHGRDIENRDRDRKILLDTLRSRGLLPDTFPASPEDVPDLDEELLVAIYRYLAQSPSRLVGVSLDDILLSIEQHNMPGTIDEHPNWRQKTVLPLEKIITKGTLMGEMMKDEGRHNK